MGLSEIIIQKIQEEGPLSFHDFMEMCLYHPGDGYYTSPSDKIGKNGDFYTSVNLGGLFGQMIGKQIEQMWVLAGTKEFTIVEYGAGTGMLCYDILEYLGRDTEFYSGLNYCIIEKSPVMRAKEKALLGERVSWHESISELPPITGCIFSNELVDNFSVHRVVMQDELMEVYIDYDGKFNEKLRPAHKDLVNYLSELDVTLPRGFRTEINLEALEWVKNIAARLKKGFLLTIDYGCVASDLYKPRRSDGTLVCYHRHVVNDLPYQNIGEQDITSHVNFSALSHWGLKWGLGTTGFTSQANFMMALGLDDHLKQTLVTEENRNWRQYAFLKYTFLMDIGQKFKVLVQQKGIPEAKLKCFAME